VSAPTLTSQTGSTWNDIVGTSETTGTLSWNTGDLILCTGFTEDASLTISTPTATGLTFSALGTAQATASSCWQHAWTATAATTSSSVVTGAIGAGGTGMRGIHAFAFGNCSGFTRTNLATQTSTKTVSVTRGGANSFIVAQLADWSASGISGLGWTPAGQTQLQAANSANATAFLAYWGDQGSTGTTSYGATGITGTKYTVFAIEVLGAGGGPVVNPVKPTILRQAVSRAANW
jgi:hypothetical protein